MQEAKKFKLNTKIIYRYQACPGTIFDIIQQHSTMTTKPNIWKQQEAEDCKQSIDVAWTWAQDRDNLLC